MIDRRRFIALAAASAAVPALRPHAAQAQAWPNRIVRLIVPNTPGGPVDVVGRLVGNRLSEIWGQQVIVENKPGAGSNIGAEAAARSAPDGYTLYMASFSHGVSRFLYPSLGYDPVVSFEPVTLVSLQPCIMVVPNSSPARSVTAFIAYAKEKDGKTSYGSAGSGTALHLAGELFKRMAGIEMTHVPYRTSAINDLIAGRLDLVFPVVPLALTVMKAGQVRGLAVTGLERIPQAPELPTISQAGLPGFNVSSWFAFFAPAKTPRDIIAKIHGDTAAALADPAVKAKLEQLGVTPVGSTPDELARHLQAEMERWGPVIADAKIKIDG